MAKAFSSLAVASVLAASLAVSGCVIIADEGSETTRITTIEQIKTDASLATVRRFSADGAVVAATLWTNCAGAENFEVKITADRFAIGVRDRARCEGEMRNLDLQWSYEMLGLGSGSQVILQNAVVL